MRIGREGAQCITSIDFAKIDPLIREGAELSIHVELSAESEGGIRENTVELSIRESLYQRGAAPEIETEETTA